MTAGSYCYIGPQGIVHGTTLVLLNAGRKYLGIGKYVPSSGETAASAAAAATPETAAETMAGRVYVSSGLGGMSGAQGKAGRIAGIISLIAEVDRAPLEKRHAQGWCVSPTKIFIHSDMVCYFYIVFILISLSAAFALAYQVHFSDVG